jgi:hypothetical protein
MARAKKNWKPIKSKESKLKNQKRISKNSEIINRLINELK